MSVVFAARTFNEVEKIVAVCAAFQNNAENVVVDIDYATKMYVDYINAGVCVLFGLLEDGEVVGGLGAIKAPDFHSRRCIASELFWFVLPGQRGGGLQLLQAFEDWAREEGCSHAVMVHLHDSMPEKLQRLYERRGYKQVEVHYLKEL